MERGVRVGFATGRPPRSVRPYVEELAPTGPLVCFNGGLVWDLATERALASRELDVNDAAAALGIARELGVHANLYIGDDIFIEEESETSRASAEKDGVVQQVVGELAPFLHGRGQGPTKILFIAPPARLAKLHFALRERDSTNVLVNSEPDYLEMLPPDTSKGAALDAIVTACGVQIEHMCAFGDNLNDLELVERVGLGVAMANAHPDLKDRADVVIDDNSGDAIARFLEEELAWVDDVLTRPRR
jgi:Cof subfamily protein (haloacid dehalogenase superfamily)